MCLSQGFRQVLLLERSWVEQRARAKTTAAECQGAVEKRAGGRPEPPEEETLEFALMWTC